MLIINQPDNSNFRINDNNVYSIIRELEEITTKVEDTEIHLLLNSRGGNIYSAYKIINVLHSKCSCLVTIIPFRAKSAATLMALGSNYIVMSPFSEIGPLDIPMDHPTLEGTGSFSALDGIKSIEYLANASLKIAFKFSSRVKENWGLSRKDCINAGLTFSANLLNPILSKLDPWTINRCDRELCIAEMYCIEFLKKYMYKNEYEAEEIAYKLKVTYPEHGFSISKDHVKSLGINIINSTDFYCWDYLWSIFKQLPKNRETIRFYPEYNKQINNKNDVKVAEKFKYNAKI